MSDHHSCLPNAPTLDTESILDLAPSPTFKREVTAQVTVRVSAETHERLIGISKATCCTILSAIPRMSPSLPRTTNEQQEYTDIPEPSSSLSTDETSTAETVVDTPLSVPDEVERVFGKDSSLGIVESMSEDEQEQRPAGERRDTVVQPSRQRMARASDTPRTDKDKTTTRRASWDLNAEHAKTKVEKGREAASESGWTSSIKRQGKPSM